MDKNKSEKIELCPYCKRNNEDLIKNIPEIFSEINIVHKKCWKILWTQVKTQLDYEDLVPHSLKAINTWAELRETFKELEDWGNKLRH